MQLSKRTLVIGATPNPNRYAFIATNMLLEYSHEVVLYGIKRGDIAGIPILKEWPAKEEIDTITLYINPRLQEQYLQKMVELKPKRIICNPGTENPELEKLARLQNIEVLNACTLVLLRTNQY
ncbi:MAG: CoA-binding protein [Bacteroidia bacterium]|nr:CoA-binding protein [Bacteroidia bacterium]